MAERESPYLWSIAAASNDDADPSINYLEGQLPSTVNNSARSKMAADARHLKDNNGSLTTTGSANAYLLTINGTQTAYATGHKLSFKASFSNTAAATLNVTNADAAALGVKAIRGPGDVALSGGEIVANGKYLLLYDATYNSAAGAWVLLNPNASGQGSILAANYPGVDPTGSADSTTALQAWIDYCQNNNKIGMFGAGTFKFTGPLTIAGGKMAVFIGVLGATFLKNASTTTDDIRIDNSSSGITSLHLEGFTLDSVSTKTAGWGIAQLSTAEGFHSSSIFRDIHLAANTFGGIDVKCGLVFSMENITVHRTGAGTNAIRLKPPSGGTINTFQLKNIKLLNGVAGTTTTALLIDSTDGPISGHLSDIQIQGGSPSNYDIGIHLKGNNTFNLYGTRCYVDTCSRSLIIEGGTDIAFSQGGFWSGSNGFDGITISGGSDIKIKGVEIGGHQRRGINVTTTSVVGLLIEGCTFYHNGFEGGGSNVYPHIALAANVSDVSIHGCFDHLAGESDTHSYSVVIAAGTGDRINITGNNFSTGLSGGVTNGATGRNNNVHSNSGSSTPNGEMFAKPLYLTSTGGTGYATLVYTGSGTITLTLPSSTTALSGADIANAFTAANTFTLANAAAITVLSGGTGSYSRLDIGRASQEAQIAVPASASQFVTGTAAGDLAINANATLWLGSGSAAGIRIGASGALRFPALASGVLQVDGSGDVSVAGAAVGGSTGATDNRFLRADGTGGATVQNSPVLCDDSGNISAVGTLATTGDITVAKANANLAINATSSNPSIQLQKAGTTQWYFYSNSAGSDVLNIVDVALDNGVSLAQNAGSWGTVSDARMKDVLGSVTILDKIDSWNLYEFVWKRNGRRDVGPLAQDVYRDFPWMVQKGDDDPQYTPKRSDDARAWKVMRDYAGMFAMQGVKELMAELEALRAEVAALKKKTN